MDWSPKQETAKRLLDKFGIDMSVVQSNHGVYDAATDSYGSTVVTYDTVGVIINPKIVSDAGVWGKSDRVRILLNGSALPTLDAIDFKVVYGSTIWNPETVVAVKPGGTPILYIIDMK